MTILIIKSFTFGVILDSGKKITSVNDSEALKTADDCSMLLKQQKNEYFQICGLPHYEGRMVSPGRMSLLA